MFFQQVSTVQSAGEYIRRLSFIETDTGGIMSLYHADRFTIEETPTVRLSPEAQLPLSLSYCLAPFDLAFVKS